MGTVSSAFVLATFSSAHICLSDWLTKAQRLFKTMADWESFSQHEYELSFHCRLELQALEGRICESSYPVFKFDFYELRM